MNFYVENDQHNIVIHKAHTKQHLIKIIQLLNLPIKYNILTKQELLEEFDLWILTNMDIEFEQNLLELKGIEDLIDYLKTPPEKAQDYKSIKDKQLLMVKARQVMAFVNNGQDLTRSFYRDKTDIMADAKLLAQQGGDMPSCRRAVYLFNTTLPPAQHIKLQLNAYTLEELKFKLKEKKNKQPIFKKREGKFTIDFD